MTRIVNRKPCGCFTITEKSDKIDMSLTKYSWCSWICWGVNEMRKAKEEKEKEK